MTAAPIVGGEPTEAWPEGVAVLFGDELGCSGVLFAPDRVATAGHCVGAATAVAMGPVLGDGPTVEVVEAWVHPEWLTAWDIGVLRLAEAVDVDPTPWVADCLVDGVVDGLAVTIVGYGATDEGGVAFPGRQMEGLTSVVDAACTDAAAGCRVAIAPGAELRIGGGGVDTCTGDSGSPAFAVIEGQSVVVALASRAAWPMTTPCGAGGIHVRADAVIDWIEVTAQTTVPRPECGDWNHPPRPEVFGPTRGPAGAALPWVVVPHDPDADPVAWSLTGLPDDGTFVVEGDLATVVPGPEPFSGVVTLRADDGRDVGETSVRIETRPLAGCTATPVGRSWWILVGVGCARRRTSQRLGKAPVRSPTGAGTVGPPEG